MKSRYDLMKNGTTKDSNGVYYKDICTYPFDKFRSTQSPVPYIITDQDRYRIDLLMYGVYGIVALDDIVLWLNGVDHVQNKSVGDTLYLPVRNDLEKFYIDNFQEEV